MNYELSSFYSNYNLGAKVVKNHELCKSLLYFTTLSNNILQKSSARKGFCAEGWGNWMASWYI